MLTLEVQSVQIEEPEKGRLEILESRIKHGFIQGLKALLEIANAIAEVHSQKLYLEVGYSTFEDYCWERWEIDLSRAYQYLDVAAIAPHLEEHNLPLPARESYYRVLAPLKREPQKLIQAWQESLASTPTGKPKAADIQKVVKKIKGESQGEEGGKKSSTHCDSSPTAHKSQCQDTPQLKLESSADGEEPQSISIPRSVWDKLHEYAAKTGVTPEQALTELLDGVADANSEVLDRIDELETENQKLQKKVQDFKGFQPRKSLPDMAKELATASINAVLPASAIEQTLKHLGMAAINLLPFNKLNDALVRGLSGLVQRPGRGGRAKGQGSSQKWALIEYCQLLNQQLCEVAV